MTRQDAIKLTLYQKVWIVGVTYQLKKNQRTGIVLKLEDRGPNCNPLATVKVPDGRKIDLDIHWLQYPPAPPAPTVNDWWGL